MQIEKKPSVSKMLLVIRGRSTEFAVVVQFVCVFSDSVEIWTKVHVFKRVPPAEGTYNCQSIFVSMASSFSAAPFSYQLRILLLLFQVVSMADYLHTLFLLPIELCQPINDDNKDIFLSHREKVDPLTFLPTIFLRGNFCFSEEGAVIEPARTRTYLPFICWYI